MLYLVHDEPSAVLWSLQSSAQSAHGLAILEFQVVEFQWFKPENGSRSINFPHQLPDSITMKIAVVGSGVSGLAATWVSVL